MTATAQQRPVVAAATRLSVSSVCGAGHPEPSSRYRVGGVLVCVMVVLLIVGMLASQTIQTLLLVRRAVDQRQSLRQARELLELGEMVLQQQVALPEADIRVDVSEAASTAVVGQKNKPDMQPSLTAEAGSAAGSVELGRPIQGRIAFQRLAVSEDGQRRVRIDVKYRPDTPGEVTVTQVVTERDSQSDETQ